MSHSSFFRLEGGRNRLLRNINAKRITFKKTVIFTVTALRISNFRLLSDDVALGSLARGTA
jgi:hypothetical protein